MTLELYHDVAPHHADSFAVRVAEGFYSGTIFHRVVKNFMIQGGFVQLVGKEGVDYFLPDEFSTLQHREGTLSMASSGQPNSAQTQFFICLSRNRSTEYLDGRYTVFGHLIKGYDVLHQIGEVPVEASQVMGGEVSQPIEQVTLIRAYLSDAEGNPITS
jgi:cyclophilin family peptidyl-prolyl cis-trans isomerase